MQFKTPFESGEEEINVMPLIDVVLMLLIFFMVTSHMKALELVPVSQWLFYLPFF